jgi:two-component system, NtrC family, sensor kinase
MSSLFNSVRKFYSDQGLDKERFDFYKKKLLFYQKHGPIENTAVCYHAMAGYFALKADYNNTIMYFLKAAEVFRQFSPSGYANEIVVTGYEYQRWGNFDLAQRYL